METRAFSFDFLTFLVKQLGDFFFHLAFSGLYSWVYLPFYSTKLVENTEGVKREVCEESKASVEVVIISFRIIIGSKLVEKYLMIKHRKKAHIRQLIMSDVRCFLPQY
jgi:hypothetical protein